MKIPAYRLVQRGPRSLERVTQQVDALPLTDRFFLGTTEARLENIFPGRRFLKLNFGRIRGGHGPGQMSLSEPVDPISLGAGRRFGEDTAAVLDKDSGYIAVQYNHFGPRAVSLEEYLTAADIDQNPGSGRHGFTIAPHFQDDFYDRLRRMEVIKELDLTISLPGARRHDREVGRALGSVLDAPLPDGTETVKLALKPARHRGASLSPEGVAMWIQDMIQHRGGGLKSGRVVGKEVAGGRSEVIDLIEDQVSMTIDLPPGLGQRVTLEDRWHALEGALRTWLANGDLPLDGTDLA
jgi:hypothetical protein